MGLPAGVADSATFSQFGGATIITKHLITASANNIALSQTPVANTALTLSGSTAGVLDTQRRVLFTVGSEAAPRHFTLTGLDSQGVAISETITIPASSSGTVASVRDYLVVTMIVPDASFTAAVTVGTNGVGSTRAQIAAGYQAIFDIGFQISIAGTANCSIEFTRDVAFAPPQIYVTGQAITLPACRWDAWPTLQGMTGEGFADIDSRVAAWRLTINSGTGTVTARATPVGLRT